MFNKSPAQGFLQQPSGAADTSLPSSMEEARRPRTVRERLMPWKFSAEGWKPEVGMTPQGPEQGSTFSHSHPGQWCPRGHRKDIRATVVLGLFRV